MRVHESKIYLSATDLANHLSCAHLTGLNLRLARNEIAQPSWENPHLRVLQKRGMEHERGYIESLRAAGMRLVDLSGLKEEPARVATLEAMRHGAQAIVQGSLVSRKWRGRTDVLLRIPLPSLMGEWSYEVVDCKLSSETKAETILQLCLYSDLLHELQGRAAERFHVIRRMPDGNRSRIALPRMPPITEVSSERSRPTWRIAAGRRIPSQSAIVISAAGGKNVMVKGEETIISPWWPALPDCIKKN